MANLQAEMDRLAPNLRAVDKMEDVEVKLKQTNVEFENARKEAKEARKIKMSV